ncbi:hypothetical protein HDA35_003143 [Micromonospora purpureochromogenes]|uniref:Uncharacterized protein n=1 Tax=Micromonospora purpureochromogenes TaxID=47872 RepID=A0ABX2RPM1_9ACTN|nr:hypothetical protein [Micromonospora purpureochromogenes]
MKNTPIINPSTFELTFITQSSFEWSILEFGIYCGNLGASTSAKSSDSRSRYRQRRMRGSPTEQPLNTARR